VTEAGQAAIREIAGTHTTDELLFKDREALRAKLVDRIQASLDAYKTGLQVTGVTIESVAVPAQVQPAFEEASKVRQDNERAVDSAKAYADQLLPRAKTDAARTIDDAKGYSNRVVSQAQGDAERFKQVYAEYSKAPAVIRQRMYLDTMEQIYSRATKVFVDSKSSNNVVYLPLDKMADLARERASAAASPASGASATAAAASAQASSPASATGSATSATVVPAPVAAASGTAASDDTSSSAGQSAGEPLRSRDAFRSRSREDDTQ
jgi:membrane protease subunit HflK